MFKFCTLFIVTLLIACAPAHNPNDDISELTQQLKEIEQLTTPDIDTYLSYFASDAVLLPPDLPAIDGKEAAFTFYKSAFETVSTWRLDYSEPAIDIAGDIATRRYTGTAAISFGGNAETIISRTKYLDVLKRQPDGTWKISIHTWGANE